MQTPPKEIEIAIVGAGVAGISAALELARLGHAGETLLFERESRVAVTSRHCDHQGFGLFEFGRPMRGSRYAEELERRVGESGIGVNLRHSLVAVEGDMLHFSTPEGPRSYRARRILFALGTRERPRSSLLVGGGRSLGILTTGSLQRFVHLHHRRPFRRPVVVGSEIVSFSALHTAREAGMEVAAMIEEEPSIRTFAPAAPIVRTLWKIPVHTSTKLLSVETEAKEVRSVLVEREGVRERIECDGVIFSGRFVPESALLRSLSLRYSLPNRAPAVTQRFQSSDPRYFLAGNVVRGALAAYRCFGEGREAARGIHDSLREDQPRRLLEIGSEGPFDWIYPSLIDLDAPHPRLCRLRFRRPVRGVVQVLVNGRELMRSRAELPPYRTLTLPWIDRPLKEEDRLLIRYVEGAG